MASDVRPAIDLEHLGTYTAGDRALELELLNMFLPNAHGYIDTMAESEGEVWWRAAHSLKGVALGVGATDVAELAESAEAQKDSAQDVREETVATLRVAMDRVRAFVAELK